MKTAQQFIQKNKENKKLLAISQWVVLALDWWEAPTLDVVAGKTRLDWTIINVDYN